MLHSLRRVTARAAFVTGTTVIASATVALLAIGMRPWFRPADPMTTLPERVPFVVEVAGPCVEVDVGNDDRHGFRLVVSCLGPAGPAWPVCLSCEPTNSVRATPVRPWALPTESRAPKWSQSDPPGEAAAPSVPTVAAHPAPRLIEPPADGVRSFHLHVTDGSMDDPAHYARVDARCVARAERVRVWLDRRCPFDAARRRQVEEIVDAAETLIPRLETDVAALRDVDGDGTLGILVTPWLGALQGGKTSLGGFVRAADFRTSHAPPFGNQADLLWLNSSPPAGAALTTLLAHELTHACALSARLAARPTGFSDEDDWIGEAIAHLSEVKHGGWSNLDHRAARFLASPARYPLVVPDYYAAGLWRNHGCRGATWSFHHWCQSRFGADYVRRVAASTVTGTATVEAATGVPFDDLFRGWTLSLIGHDGQFDAGRSDGAGTSPIGRVGRFELDGPRVDHWDGTTPRTLDIAGGATAFIDWTPPARGPVRLRVDAPPDAKLQLTIVRVPREELSLPIDAAWLTDQAPDMEGSPGERLDSWDLVRTVAPTDAAVTSAGATNAAGADTASLRAAGPPLGQRAADPPPFVVQPLDLNRPVSRVVSQRSGLQHPDRHDGPDWQLFSATLERFTQTEVRTYRFDPDAEESADQSLSGQRSTGHTSTGRDAGSGAATFSPPSGRRSVVALDRSARSERDGDWIVRVVAVDRQGRRRVGWTELPPPSESIPLHSDRIAARP